MAKRPERLPNPSGDKELRYNITQNPVHIRDLHATILYALGIQHEMLTYKFQGLDNRLTGVLPAKIIKDLFA